MADISAAQSAESATESGEMSHTIQALEEKWENRFDQLSAMIKILAEGSAAKASKRRAHICDSSSDDEPPKKSKKVVGTAPTPQTLGDAETDSDGKIRDDTLSAAGSDDDLLVELDKDLDEGEKMAMPLLTRSRILWTNRSSKNCLRTS